MKIPKRFDRVRRDEISNIVTFANISIWLVLFLITFAFVKVTLKDVPLGEALSNANPQYIQSILLSIYVTCWGIGCTVDTIFQGSIYLVDPLGGRVRLSAIIPVAAIGIKVSASKAMSIRLSSNFSRFQPSKVLKPPNAIAIVIANPIIVKSCVQLNIHGSCIFILTNN